MSRHGKVLVIDDEPGVRERLQSWLDKQGYNYIFVRNEEAARSILEHHRFDAIFHGREFRYPPGFLSVRPPAIALRKAATEVNWRRIS